MAFFPAAFQLLSSFAITCHFFFGLLIIPISRQTPDCDIALWTQILWTWTWKTRTGVNTFPAKYMLREAIIREKKDFLWNHFIKWWPPLPRPPFMKSLFIFFPTIFWSKKKMILKVVWRVLMGVLRVLEGCCRVFEVCLEGVWKNKIEVCNQSDPPPPFTKWFHKKSFFSQLRASLISYM